MSKKHHSHTLNVLVVVVALIVAIWSIPARAPSPPPASQRRPLIKRVLRFVALWWVASSAHQLPQPRRSPVDELYNADPPADEKEVDHAYGW